MKKIFFAIISLAAILFASCAKNEQAAPQKGQVVRVSASAADMISKVASNTSGRFTWQSGDAIGIWTGSEITKFVIDEEWAGFGYAEFVGTLPEGGAINEASYAVYPYDDINLETATATTCEYKALSNWGIPQTVIRLYSKATLSVKEDKVADFAFKHCNAYFRVTLKNVRADAGCVFIESNKQFLPKVSSIDFSGETPQVTVTETNDWTHQVFPAHEKVIDSYTILIPIAPVALDSNFKFVIKLYSGENFTGSKFMEHTGWFITPTFIAGDYYIFPEITYPNAKSANDTGSGINDGIEDSIVTVEGDSFWTVGK